MTIGEYGERRGLTLRYLAIADLNSATEIRHSRRAKLRPRGHYNLP
jgi:hypothetical protein